MTKDEAEAIAAKREAHKSPRLKNGKSWQAVHDSVNGWHVALVDDPLQLAASAHMRAHTALRRGDMDGFLNAASDHLLARVQASLAKDQPA